MNSSLNSLRVLALIRKFERIPTSVDLLYDRPEALAPAMAHLEQIEASTEAFIAALQPGAGPVKLIEGAELWQSLATAIVAIARERRSGRFSAKDLKDLVENHAPARDLAFWVKQFAGRVQGLLREVAELRKLIEAEGVLFWEYPGDPDHEWRIVDTRWFTAHADIRRWVTKPWPGGRTCRFCGCQESERVNALELVDVERRNGLQMIGDTVVLQVGGALTHDPCRKYWINWCSIAAKYSSHAQAQAADKAAGRVSRYEKVVNTSALLEAPAP